MARILILIILGWILYQIIKRMAASSDPKPTQKANESLAQCAHCGCQVPESECIVKNNKIVCNNPECLNK